MKFILNFVRRLCLRISAEYLCSSFFPLLLLGRIIYSSLTGFIFDGDHRVRSIEFTHRDTETNLLMIFLNVCPRYE